MKNLAVQRSSAPAWIFNDPNFTQWLESTESGCQLLWLSGTTGFGKSVLAAYLTEALVQKFPTDTLAYFFCKDNTFLQSAHQIVRAIVHQFSARSELVRKAAKQIWENSASIAELTAPIEDLFDLLLVPAMEALLSTSDRVFLIIDGLNECQESNLSDVMELIRLFGGISISTLNVPQIRILITCQPKHAIATALRDSNTVTLFAKHNRENIDSYLKQKLDDTMLRKFRDVGIDPYEFFEKKHNGMFLSGSQ